MGNSLAETAGKGNAAVNPVQIRVFWDTQRTSKNQRLHWAARARLVKQSKDAAIVGWLQAGCPRAAGPVVVSFLVYRGRRLDDDNALSGLYGVRDALFNGRITPNDSPDWVRLGSIKQVTGADWRRHPMVDVLIEPVIDEDTAKHPLDYQV